MLPYSTHARLPHSRIPLPACKTPLYSLTAKKEAQHVLQESRDFPSFSKLPIELRTQIWRMALSPRIITMKPRLDGTDTLHVELTTECVELLHTCRESRREALRCYSPIAFNDVDHSSTHVGWSYDTLFLDLPEECLDINHTMARMSTAFQSVQSLAIRIRAHCFLGFPEFLRRSTELQRLIFVDDRERPCIINGECGQFYLMGNDQWGLVRGFTRFLGAPDWDQLPWFSLARSEKDGEYGIRQWEMPLEVIMSVRELIKKEERYFLLLC